MTAQSPSRVMITSSRRDILSLSWHRPPKKENHPDNVNPNPSHLIAPPFPHLTLKAVPQLSCARSIHTSTVMALKHYFRRRDQMFCHPGESCFFLSDHGTSLDATRQISVKDLTFQSKPDVICTDKHGPSARHISNRPKPKRQSTRKPRGKARTLDALWSDQAIPFPTLSIP